MNENGFSLFANPFTADIDNSPTWIDRHSKQSDFKNVYPENYLFNFYNLYVWTEKFPKLWCHAKNVAYFGSTYCCSFFINEINKNKI